MPRRIIAVIAALAFSVPAHAVELSGIPDGAKILWPASVDVELVVLVDGRPKVITAKVLLGSGSADGDGVVSPPAPSLSDLAHDEAAKVGDPATAAKLLDNYRFVARAIGDGVLETREQAAKTLAEVNEGLLTDKWQAWRQAVGEQFNKGETLDGFAASCKDVARGLGRLVSVNDTTSAAPPPVLDRWSIDNFEIVTRPDGTRYARHVEGHKFDVIEQDGEGPARFCVGVVDGVKVGICYHVVGEDE